MTELATPPLEQLRLRRSAKWRTYPADVLPLPVAEMDFELAPPITEALHAAVSAGDLGYVGTTPELCEAFAGFAERRWGWAVDPGQVLVATDVSVAAVETLRVLAEPGATVAYSPPVYNHFRPWITEAGLEPVCVPLLGPDGEHPWRLDLDGLEAAFRAGLAAYLLCSPHNPVGAVLPRADLEALAALAEQFDVVVISDEIHAPLVQDQARHVPFLSVSDAARRVGITVTSASKAWNLAGLKCALIVTADTRQQRVTAQLSEDLHYRSGMPGVVAATAAYAHGDTWLDDCIQTLDARRRQLADLLDEHLPAVRYTPPAATYLAWLDFRATPWADDPAQHALDQAKVGLSAGQLFGEAGRGFARLNFATSPQILDQAVRALSAAL